MTVEEFLSWDDGTDTRYELIDGQPMAMAPGLMSHGALTARFAGLFLGRIPKTCAIISEAGVRIPGRDDRYYVADLVVTCTPGTSGQLWVEAPRLIVEVLSPSTKGRDLEVKMRDYRRIPSVRCVVFASATERWVQVWKRVDVGWLVTDHDGEGLFQIDGVEGDLSLTEVYTGVVV